MSADDYPHPVRLYHGTAHEFAPGDLVEPSHELGGLRGKSHAYMTTDPGVARDYGRHKADAQRAIGAGARGRAYEVRPAGRVERDDTVAEHLSAWRTRHPLEIVRAIGE